MQRPMTESYRVAIVVDREFGPQLADLAQRSHVWVCDSPANRPATEAVWRTNEGQYDFQSGVTIFECSPEESPDDALVNILETVDLHHAWSVIEVIGCKSSPRFRSTFAEYGAVITELRPDHFEARR